MTLKVQTHTPTYFSVTAQKMLKIDETVMPVEIRFFRKFRFYQVCYGWISQTYQSMFNLECFSFVKVSHISERSFRSKFNSSLSDWPNNFSYLFILLNRNSVHLNLNTVSLKLKRKRKVHTRKWLSTWNIKTDDKTFQKRVLSLRYLLFYILNTSINDKPNQSNRHLFTIFWLDKSLHL